MRPRAAGAGVLGHCGELAFRVRYETHQGHIFNYTSGTYSALFHYRIYVVISASTSQDTENLNTAPPPAKRKLDDYFTKTKSDDDNLDDVLARMIALDGFPFSVFITSDNLRKLLLAKYTDLPKSAVTIQKRVMNYSEK
ncbi:hypothetical protein EVAR_76177_1 [Eumeta japonica]|uniref:Uncharacterized protein n=1 Tax=Eumeta variegata TaxID=151549 RepID=A0A4C1UVW3_EUMVA|nr:hypothetical protein EVAR_76177_1 [Eumeta japonica]